MILRLFALVLLLLLPAFPARSEEKSAVAGAAGEILVYDIALLWFDRVAEGRLSFSPGDLPGTFRAELEARTLGVAARLTGDRAQRYVSLMEPGANGRLRSLSHEATIVKKKGERQEVRGKRYLFDYRKGEVLYQRFKGEAPPSQRKIDIDRANPPNDILTAFYNLRRGAFGPLQPGGHYVIPAFSHKGRSNIVVDIVPAGGREDESFFPKRGLLARVTVDPEVFDTGGGYVYVWFDEEGRPVRGIVENVAGLGDVRGILRDK